MSERERAACIEELCALTAAILAGRDDREQVLSYEEPKSARAQACWMELVRRGREKRHRKPA